MTETLIFTGNYQIEVSGWGLNNIYFVEKCNLLWADSGEKKLMLRHAVPEGAVIFVRLIGPETSFDSVPVAYRVAGVQPMNSDGLCEMQLLQLHPQSKVPTRNKLASLSMEDSSNGYENEEKAFREEQEEVLHEA